MTSGIHPKLQEAVTLGGVAVRALPGFTLHSTESRQQPNRDFATGRTNGQRTIHLAVYKRDSDGMCFSVAWAGGIPAESHDKIWSDFEAYIAAETPRYN